MRYWTKREQVSFPCALLVAVGFTLTPAHGGILDNGSFESGDFTGWSVFDNGSGNWLVLPGGIRLAGGEFTPTPTDGKFQAVTDQTGPGAHVFFQEFVVPSGGVVEFDMWWVNLAEVWFNNGTLDQTDSPNQHARVDLLVPGSDPFSTDPADVVMNLLTLDSGPFSGGYEHQAIDVSGLAGQTVWLRFAEVDNQLFFNFAIDNVIITPAPASIVLFTLAGFVGCRRRRTD